MPRAEPSGTLVIFDCDGVLVDSERIGLQVDQRILREYGLELTDDEVIERFIGKSRDFFISSIEAAIGSKIALNWEEVYGPWYFEAFERDLAPIDGIEEVLAHLSHESCVASSGPRYKIAQTLSITRLDRYFGDRIYSADDVRHGKPAPDLFLHAADKMGFSPGQCIVIEDSRFGVQAAKAAGMAVIGYAGGISPRGWLEAESVPLIDHMRELPALLAEMSVVL
jgi:HAD superfamily hydrolase (TIGR01509 family)